MIKFIILFLLNSVLLRAGTFNNNAGAFFAQNTVNVRVASNTTCVNAGTSVDELVEMISPAINDYWNTVTMSRLRLENGGTLETSDNNFNVGKLCNVETDDLCIDNGGLIPKVTEIVITCNSDLVDNFSGGKDSTAHAIALPNNISGNGIAGSVIIINNTASSPFQALSYQQKVWVLAHEIGHAIGIGHTTSDANLMYYTLSPERFALGPDDVMAMSYLYPKRFDGCGIFSTEDVSKNSGGGFGTSFFFGIFSFLLLQVAFKKFFFKLKKSVV